ncbi:WXG100 family type VII secretion target [Clostridium bornimense]|uniref:WXG100 family type VII secretion target n=1 Tax=Clostridium bornimense TaxID=1216932 RepID=UPI001C0F3D09|nr:WXG100 family type VII secretion target [uncultured Clostridium sp.]MBU5315326.1 WXG100 family type VII secretion target [Clostridium bornimense]
MDFSVDPCKLREVEALYKESIDTLENTRVVINNSLKELRGESWQVKTKESFSDVLNLDWEKGLSEHIQKIDFLRDILTEVADKMENIESQGEAIGNRL